MAVLRVNLCNTEKLRGNRDVFGRIEDITTGSMQVTDLKKKMRRTSLYFELLNNFASKA